VQEYRQHAPVTPKPELTAIQIDVGKRFPLAASLAKCGLLVVPNVDGTRPAGGLRFSEKLDRSKATKKVMMMLAIKLPRRSGRLKPQA